MKKVFCSLLVVLMVLALFVSCDDKKNSASAAITFYKYDGETDALKEEEIDFSEVESVQINYGFFNKDTIGIEKADSCSCEYEGINMVMVSLSEEEIKALGKTDTITLTNLPEGFAIEFVVYVDGFEYQMDNSGSSVVTPCHETEYYTLLEKGETTTVKVVLCE